MSLLKTLAFRGPEDISTEVVAYLLETKEKNIPFQRLFYNHVINCIKSTSDLAAEISTQIEWDESGRPDITILSTEAVIVGETKLGSYLSTDDQLIRYAEMLTKGTSLQDASLSGRFKHPKSRILIFLAPERLINPSINTCNRVTMERYGKDFLAFLGEKNIRFVSFPWEMLITFLDIENPIQRELFLLVEGYINQELTKEEKMALSDREVPNGLNKLIKIVDELKSHIHSLGFKDSRMGQSWNFYGFFINGKDLKCWFGYMLPIWAEHNTPIFLQIQENWIVSRKEEVTELLGKEGFVLHKTQGYLKPFELKSDTKWKQELVDIINKIIVEG